jgi:hypothetical protein
VKPARDEQAKDPIEKLKEATRKVDSEKYWPSIRKLMPEHLYDPLSPYNPTWGYNLGPACQAYLASGLKQLAQIDQKLNLK